MVHAAESIHAASYESSVLLETSASVASTVVWVQDGVVHGVSSYSTSDLLLVRWGLEGICLRDDVHREHPHIPVQHQESRVRRGARASLDGTECVGNFGRFPLGVPNPATGINVPRDSDGGSRSSGALLEPTATDSTGGGVSGQLVSTQRRQGQQAPTDRGYSS